MYYSDGETLLMARPGRTNTSEVRKGFLPPSRTVLMYTGGTFDSSVDRLPGDLTQKDLVSFESFLLLSLGFRS